MNVKKMFFLWKVHFIQDTKQTGVARGVLQKPLLLSQWAILFIKIFKMCSLLNILIIFVY